MKKTTATSLFLRWSYSFRSLLQRWEMLTGERHPPLGLLGMAVRATPSFVFCYFILASCAFTSAVMSLLIASFT